MEVIQALLLVIALLIAVPVIVYTAEIVAACWPRAKREPKLGCATRPRLAVLVPAHNEQAGIAATLISIAAQLREGDRLLVVADNCTDATAEVARSVAIAQGKLLVAERSDELRRGKGFALSFGLERLIEDPPEVVVLLDADCRLGADALTRLAIAAAAKNRPAQGRYLCEPSRPESAAQRMSALAFRVRNLVRMAGLNRLGGPCHLTGSGIALPWALVDKVAWATGNVVEDMQLGIDFALAGFGPVFVEDAVITSDLPASEAGLATQRRRWEHGFLTTALTQVPQLTTHAVEQRSWPLALLALDLTIPPLALLATTLVAAWFLAALVALLGVATLPWVILSVACALLAASTLLAWYVHCRDVAPMAEIASVPRYVLGKLPLYLQFIARRETKWIRTER
jgi:cellulose synthase/poly-beta-1,6-N-acetylglucosamine synthase-like glycosyltransferase